MRIAIYARVSTDDKGQDPENQLRQGCLARCRRSWHRQPRSIPVLPWRGTPVRCRTGYKRECPAGEVGQNVDHIDRLKLAVDTDRQAFMGELVEHVEHPVLASLVGAVLDKVVGPDMIALLRPQPNARSVGQPEPAALGLLMGNLEPLTLPDTLDPLVVDCPARLAQQRGDLAIAVAAVLPGKLDNIGGETPLLVTTTRDLALRRAMLPERGTGTTLGDVQLRSHLLNAGTATRGA